MFSQLQRCQRRYIKLMKWKGLAIYHWQEELVTYYGDVSWWGRRKRGGQQGCSHNCISRSCTHPGHGKTFVPPESHLLQPLLSHTVCSSPSASSSGASCQSTGKKCGCPWDLLTLSFQALDSKSCIPVDGSQCRGWTTFTNKKKTLYNLIDYNAEKPWNRRSGCKRCLICTKLLWNWRRRVFGWAWIPRHPHRIWSILGEIYKDRRHGWGRGEGGSCSPLAQLSRHQCPCMLSFGSLFFPTLRSPS